MKDYILVNSGKPRVSLFETPRPFPWRQTRVRPSAENNTRSTSETHFVGAGPCIESHDE